jgi:hypothetical protein
LSLLWRYPSIQALSLQGAFFIALPEEYLPFLLQMMRAFRESVTLKSAAESFRQGWCEAQSGMTSPLEQLWDGIDAR